MFKFTKATINVLQDVCIKDWNIDAYGCESCTNITLLVQDIHDDCVSIEMSSYRLSSVNESIVDVHGIIFVPKELLYSKGLKAVCLLNNKQFRKLTNGMSRMSHPLQELANLYL
jgi:hypothetical protein|tara:strand:+ start:619 stop:960 length:342 start_codon:yes stop_codon:yes gene_type:complete